MRFYPRCVRRKVSGCHDPTLCQTGCMYTYIVKQLKQESPDVVDKPTRRESMPKIAPIRRAYNVVADNTGLSSFI